MRLSLLYIIFSFFSSPLFGQFLEVGVGPTLGTYSMKGLKSLQKDMLNEIDFVPAKVVESFPATIGYDLQFVYCRKSFNLGGFFSYSSTGGRIHYRDYSGELKLDQIVNGYSFGVATLWRLKNTNKIQVIIGARTGSVISDLILNNVINVSGQPIDQQTDQFRSVNWILSPIIDLGYPIKKMTIFTSFRYDINGVKSDFVDKENEGQVIQLNNGQNLQADWDGFRFTLGIKYNFSSYSE